MEKKNYFAWGIIFFIIGIISIARNYETNYIYFFWFCDFVPFVYAILFFIKKDDMVKGLVNIGIIPQIVFLIGILYKLIFDVSLLGFVTDNIQFNLFYISSTIVIHLSSILAFYLTIKTKPGYKTLIYSFIFLVLIYIIALLFTSPNMNVNYVYGTGNLLRGYEIPYYIYIWLPLAFILVVLPTQLIQYLAYRIKV